MNRGATPLAEPAMIAGRRLEVSNHLGPTNEPEVAGVDASTSTECRTLSFPAHRTMAVQCPRELAMNFIFHRATEATSFQHGDPQRPSSEAARICAVTATPSWRHVVYAHKFQTE